MTQEELEALPQWKNLTDRERVFFTAYLANDCDAEAAVDAAYGSKSRQSALSTARRLMANKNLALVFNAIDGGGALDEGAILRQAAILARTASSDQVRLSALTLSAQMLGLMNRAKKAAREDDLELLMREKVDNAE